MSAYKDQKTGKWYVFFYYRNWQGENKGNNRIFQISKSYLHHEMDRGAKAAGIKRIKIHGLRHSHISLLIHLGYSALAIGERVGHASVNTTYWQNHFYCYGRLP